MLIIHAAALFGQSCGEMCKVDLARHSIVWQKSVGFLVVLLTDHCRETATSKGSRFAQEPFNNGNSENIPFKFFVMPLSNSFCRRVLSSVTLFANDDCRKQLIRTRQHKAWTAVISGLRNLQLFLANGPACFLKEGTNLPVLHVRLGLDNCVSVLWSRGSDKFCWQAGRNVICNRGRYFWVSAQIAHIWCWWDCNAFASEMAGPMTESQMKKTFVSLSPRGFSSVVLTECAKTEMCVLHVQEFVLLCLQTALHYYSSLNALQYKRKFCLIEPILGYMHAQRSFFTMSKDAVAKDEIDDFLSNINASCQAWVQPFFSEKLSGHFHFQVLSQFGIKLLLKRQCSFSRNSKCAKWIQQIRMVVHHENCRVASLWFVLFTWCFCVWAGFGRRWARRHRKQ